MDNSKRNFLEFYERYFKKEMGGIIPLLDIPPQHPKHPPHVDLVIHALMSAQEKGLDHVVIHSASPRSVEQDKHEILQLLAKRAGVSLVHLNKASSESKPAFIEATKAGEALRVVLDDLKPKYKEDVILSIKEKRLPKNQSYKTHYKFHK